MKKDKNNWNQTGNKMKEASLKASKALDKLSDSLNKLKKPSTTS